MARSTSNHDDRAASRRSRREMLAGGAAGALGVFALEALVDAPPAEAVTTVQTVTAGDASITVIGTAANPKIETGTLDKIASLHPPTAAVNFNSQKGTKVANGTAAHDIAAFGQTTAGGNGAPMTGPGDLIYGGTSGVPARLAGDTSGTRKFLCEQSSGGVPAAPAWGTLQASDVPQLSVYAPAGLTGATAASRWVGATASGAPVSGTFATGDFVIDQSGAIWVCTSGGSPGTWASVGAGTTTGAANYAGMFGDGSDGPAVLDGTAVPEWATLDGSGSVYTMAVDCFCEDLTIAPGITLLSNARRILCFGTLTNNGTISNDGAGASGSSGGPNGSYSSLVSGGTGGNGGVNTGSDGDEFGAAAGGAGGRGGDGTSGTGGNGGSAPAERRRLRYPTALISGALYNNDTGRLALGGGSGGGGGGGDGANSGGGGGAGAGLIAIWAQAVVNNGSFSAKGGSGAGGTGGDTGGGGAGGGGTIVAYTLSPWTGTGTTTVDPGTPGAGTGAGTNGAAAATGVVLNVIVR